MAGQPLSVDIAKQTIEAFQKHGTKVEAARALGISTETFKSRLIRSEFILAEAATKGEPTDDGPYLHFEDAWKGWQKAIGMSKDRYKRPSRQAEQGTKKILVMPDLHAPFHEEGMFAEMLRAEGDADLVIGIGDIGDAYALSRFEQYEHCPYRDEWASVTLVIQELASRFPEVELVLGNHDIRLERQLRSRVTLDMVDAIKFMTGGTLCPITAIANRYPNVRIARHETPSGHTIDWFTTVGDAWLGHPEKFSRVPGSVLRSVEEWVEDNREHFGLEQFRLIAVGHTHQMGLIPWRANKYLCEVGCLCKTQGYMTSPRIGGRPQRRGYMTFTQTDGYTNLNSVRLRWLDAEM